MKILWSIPVRGERLSSSRGDLVRARHLIGALREQGHEVHVVEACEQPVSDISVSVYRRLIRDLMPGRAAYVVRDLGRWLQGRAHGRRLTREARSRRADLIIETHVNFSVSGALAARSTGLPLILDDCSPGGEEEPFGTGLPRLSKLLLKRQAEAASAILVSSESLLARLAAEGAPEDKLAVVPNGVDPDAFTCAERQRMRARFGMGERCVLGFVGSFQPWHRVELLVEAAANLAKLHPIHLLLVGDGPGRESAIHAAQRAGLADHMTAVGAVSNSEVPRLLSACDVGVLPATNDYGQPMKLLDYAAAALPSVAPDVPPVRELVRDGFSGLLFRSGDPGALQSALARLVADPELRQHMGGRARAHALGGMSWSDRARALVSCIQRLSAAATKEDRRDDFATDLKFACERRLS